MFIVDASQISAFSQLFAAMASNTVKFQILNGDESQSASMSASAESAAKLLANGYVRAEVDTYGLSKGSRNQPGEDVRYCLWLHALAGSLGAGIMLHPRRVALLQAVLEAMGYSAQSDSLGDRSAALTRRRYVASSGGGEMVVWSLAAAESEIGGKSDPGAASDVFISYARPDREIADALAKDLARRGYTTWRDENLAGSDNFREAIQHHLRNAGCVVVIWTPRSVISRFVREEADDALRRGKLIATRTRDLTVFEIPLGFREQQTEFIDRMDKVEAAVAKICGPRVGTQ
ncbi:MAG TPA: toll/interleukin-1 receptor domain-containing protein [Rhizomicrobium sp.]|nr:toll/interleukin-1 receptor domain-containing protein [Rhizomicrobium sp.]